MIPKVIVTRVALIARAEAAEKERDKLREELAAAQRKIEAVRALAKRFDEADLGEIDADLVTMDLRAALETS